MAPRFLATLQVHLLLSLNLRRCQHAIPNVFALRVAEHIDVVEHILLHIVSGFADSGPDAFVLQQIEQALGNRC